MRVDDLEVTPDVLLAMCKDAFKLGVAWGVIGMYTPAGTWSPDDDELIELTTPILARTLGDKDWLKRWIQYLLEMQRWDALSEERQRRLGLDMMKTCKHCGSVWLGRDNICGECGQEVQHGTT